MYEINESKVTENIFIRRQSHFVHSKNEEKICKKHYNGMKKQKQQFKN